MIIDLHFKRLGVYRFASHFGGNKGYWYWLSMRSKLPHFIVGDTWVGAIATRFVRALTALDEMGMQFYQGQNNDTLDNILYHFQYLITLLTGILDNLAIKTADKIGANGLNPSHVSLNNSAGGDFLKLVRESEPTIRQHITSFAERINLVYAFRELVIHREGTQGMGFKSATTGDVWEAGVIRASPEQIEALKHCKDQARPYDQFSQWGKIDCNAEIYIEPYHFSIKLLDEFTPFIDKYLELLGFPLFSPGGSKFGEFGFDLNQIHTKRLGY